MPTAKLYTRQITERFLKEMDRIVGFDGNQKVNQYDFAEKVGISTTNLTRMKSSVNNNVTLEACNKLIQHYGTDPMWLYMGEDYEAKVDERIQAMDKMIVHLGKLISQQTERKPLRARGKG